jgi:alkaline phosphatase D
VSDSSKTDGLRRRDFLDLAAGLGAALAWPGQAQSVPLPWTENRELFPEGVASGDPDSHSVILWTRRPFRAGARVAHLDVEVSSRSDFETVIARARAPVLEVSDWTCRALVAGLKPATTYWYRFTDSTGSGSRVGRTRTAPLNSDARPVRFAAVSCQNVNMGAQHAWRRMILEDKRADASEQLDFVLHLGDFIYEVVWYPEDRPHRQRDGRRLRDIVRYPHGEKIGDFHVPTDVDDYRAVYRAYLHDPDIQDARARFPFVAMWDNHEFSWRGWQGLQVFNDQVRPAQTVKVAANQAWFEYQPARVLKPGRSGLERFAPPAVANAPVLDFDEHGLGTERNNRRAVDSLIAYRALRWGKNVDLIITDQHSYRSEDPSARPEIAALIGTSFSDLLPEEINLSLDAGREAKGGAPPAELEFGDRKIANFRGDQPRQTVLGQRQKQWFLKKLKASSATWKIWANSQATLDWRVDPQNLPADFNPQWPGKGYASFGGGDFSSAWLERAEIYEVVRSEGITGFATVAGDRHSFWAGYSSKDLPPAGFEPIGIAFVTASISTPGLAEIYTSRLAKDHPLRPLYLADRSHRPPETVANLTFRHGVRAALDYVKTGDLSRLARTTNPELAPHMKFLDLGGYGYSVVTATPDNFSTDFVCIDPPLERDANGGVLRYRVRHSCGLWAAGETPELTSSLLDGDPGLSAA